MDEFTCICRSTSRYFDLVRRLVLWGPTPEALQEAEHLGEDELVQLADLLVAVGQSVKAMELVETRLAARQEGPLADWLARHRQDQQRQEKLLQLKEQMFLLEPCFEAFLQIRRLARAVGRWDQLRPQLLAQLESLGQWGLLAQILLEEKELGRALALLESHPDEGLECWELPIAEAAERLYPAEALEIYRRRVDRLVN